MSYRIELIPPARAEIKQLNGYLRSLALELIAALGDEPRPPRAKELRGKPNIYRIWLAGRWRIAYEIDEENERIFILRVRGKKRIDYDSLTSWIHEPGLPSDCPRPHGAAFAAVEKQVRRWRDGTEAGALETEGWSTHEWLHFLGALPPQTDAEALGALDRAFALTRSRNSEILAAWLHPPWRQWQPVAW